MKNVFLCVFFLITVSLMPSEEIFFRAIKGAPAWENRPGKLNSNNIILEIKKDTIVKGIKFYLSTIDTQLVIVCEIEYNGEEYIVQADMFVPAYTVDLFDNSWITSPISDSLWVLDYYLRVLLTESRNTFYEYEHETINYLDTQYEYWYYSGFTNISECLQIYQIGISAGGFLTKDFLITNIVKINNGYKATVVDMDFGRDDIVFYANTIPFPTDRHSFDLLLIQDNDFMDMYLDTTENHLATFVRVGKDITDELDSLLKNDTCDLSKIKSFPKRAAKQLNVGEECRILENLRLRETPGATGAVIKTLEQGSKVTILEIGQNETIDGVTAPWVKVKTSNGETGWCFGLYLQETRFDPTPEELAVKMKSNTENTAVSNDDKNQASPLPLWAWFVFIGIAVAVSGGVAVFVVLRKKAV